MNELREELIDRMVRIYGFENPIVNDFCTLCEEWEDNEWNDHYLTLLVIAHEDEPWTEEEEED